MTKRILEQQYSLDNEEIIIMNRMVKKGSLTTKTMTLIKEKRQYKNDNFIYHQNNSDRKNDENSIKYKSEDDDSHSAQSGDNISQECGGSRGGTGSSVFRLNGENVLSTFSSNTRQSVLCPGRLPDQLCNSAIQQEPTSSKVVSQYL